MTDPNSIEDADSAEGCIFCHEDLCSAKLRLGGKTECPGMVERDGFLECHGSNLKFTDIDYLCEVPNEADSKKAEDLCKEHGLTFCRLVDFFKLSSRGLQTQDVADRLNVHRVTVSRYRKSLREMKDSDFDFLYNYVINNSQVILGDLDG